MTTEVKGITSNGYQSDSEGEGDEQHKQFLAALAKLDKGKHVPPSARHEPSLQVSEFHLSKESEDQRDEVQLWQLAKAVSQRPSHRNVARKLKSIQRKSLTLPKPLEKPEADKIQREVGYEEVKSQLQAWEPIVYNQRAANNLVFPLKSSNESLRVTAEDFLSDKQVATELEKKMHEILNQNNPSEEDKGEEFSLTLEEMIQRRKELARLRVRESYRHAKAHYQNKIKSKKYHRLAKRERVRNQLKEFESLQLKNPEAALEKLEELEKERALERASLRHRSTGKWAKNQAVRAKYDKESRQILSEQLKLSKSLTQKLKSDSESSEGECDIVDHNEASDNPWVSNKTKTESEVEEFLSGYRKFWDKKSVEGVVSEKPLTRDSSPPKPSSLKNGITACELETARKNAVVSYTEIHPKSVNYSKFTASDDKSPAASTQNVAEESCAVNDCVKSTKEPRTIKVVGSKSLKSTCGKWHVTSLTKADNSDKMIPINKMFENLHKNISKKAKEKLLNFQNDLYEEKTPKNSYVSKKKSEVENDKNLLEMKKQNQLKDIDEGLHEGVRSSVTENTTHKMSESDMLSRSNTNEVDKTQKKGFAHIELDPNKFISPKPVKLSNLLPDETLAEHEGLDDSDAEEHGDARHLTIAEAFEDDDVVAEFSKEKENTINKAKPGDIDLGLPGWGEWGGHKVKQNMRKRKRFLVKMPEAPPRKDANKGNLIINENEDSAARAHQVHSLPYPFTRVRDFEASIRAPISSTFIPQSAHRKLIKPAVRTKLGTIIEPIDKSVILNRQGKSVDKQEHIRLDVNKEKRFKRQ